jgi:hypothetical protein
VVARGQGADCRRVVCRRSERLGGGAAVWTAAAAGLCLAAAGPRRCVGAAGGRGAGVCAGRTSRRCRQSTPGAARITASAISISTMPAGIEADVTDGAGSLSAAAAGSEGGAVIPVPPGVRVLIATRSRKRTTTSRCCSRRGAIRRIAAVSLILASETGCLGSAFGLPSLEGAPPRGATT